MPATRFDHRRLRELRRRADLSPEQVAIEIGRSAQTVGLYERGGGVPPVDCLMGLAKALNVDIGDFFTDEGGE